MRTTGPAPILHPQRGTTDLAPTEGNHRPSTHPAHTEGSHRSSCCLSCTHRGEPQVQLLPILQPQRGTTGPASTMYYGPS
ncbi:hypothetical protein FKM82_024844 [Ascaphus truei]